MTNALPGTRWVDPAARPAAAGAASAPGLTRLVWPDVIRVLAAGAIFVFHFAGGYARLGDGGPSGAVRFIESHFSYWAIAAFVVLSGFSLALGRLQAEEQHYRRYVSRRLTRLFAPYWTVAVPLIVIGFARGEAPTRALWKVPIWLLGLGPISPETYLPISQVWWYVSLALQISLLVPLVAWSCRRLGVLTTTILALGVNAVALQVIAIAPDRWNPLTQGLVFARLAEVMVGVVAASILLSRRSRAGRPVRELLCALLLVAGAPILWRLGARTDAFTFAVLAAVFVACAFFMTGAARPRRWLAAAAALTYVFFLSHAPLTGYVLTALFDRGFDSFFITLPLVLVTTVSAAWLADWIARRYVARRVERGVGLLLHLEPEGRSG